MDSRGGKDYKISFRDNELSMVNIYMTEDRNCNILELRRGVRGWGNNFKNLYVDLKQQPWENMSLYRGHFDRKEETAKDVIQKPSRRILRREGSTVKKVRHGLCLPGTSPTLPADD